VLLGLLAWVGVRAGEEGEGAGRWWAALPAAGILGAGSLAWCVLRVPLDPSAVGSAAFLGGVVLGVAPGGCRAGPRVVLGGLAAAFLAVAAAIQADPWRLLSLPALAKAGPYAGTTGLLALGVGVGLSASAAGGAIRHLARVGPITALGALALVPLLPPDLSARATWGAATVARHDLARARADAVHLRSVLEHAGLGGTGAEALHRRDSARVVEIEGVLVEGTGRAAEAERFGGLLAACATAGRARARTAGDDLGLAAGVLRRAGFEAIEASTPTPALTRAIAAADPDFRELALSARVALLRVPGPLLLAAGMPADAVVQVVRTPWTDARSAPVSGRTLAATHRRVADQGVHVLVLGTLALGPEAFSAIARAFADEWPSASLWLPPGGADTAILLGAPDALSWTGLEACVAADKSTVRRLGLRDALDVATLALAGDAALGSLPPGPPMWGLPPTLLGGAQLPLTRFSGTAEEAAGIFDGAPVDLAARAETRARLLAFVRGATGGDLQDAIAQARALDAAPGGARALDALIEPNLALARSYMARARADGPTSGYWARAESELMAARALAPRSAVAACLDGELSLSRGQAERAERAFRSCTELDGSRIEGWEGLARICRNRGDAACVEDALRTAQARAPDRWETAHNLGAFLLETGRYADAEGWMKQGATLADASGTSTAVPYLALAELYLRDARPFPALAAANRAAAIAPSAETDYLTGAANWELGQAERAEAAFRAALEKDPQHVRARGDLGRCLAARGDFAGAAEAFRAVLLRDPRNVGAQENLRRAELLAGKQGD
jgi:Tfp pilus assembly protein PilF